MTGYTVHVKQFDDYLSRNYSELRTTAQKICWNFPSYEDILHSNLIKVRQRIMLSGWTNTLYQHYDRSIYSYLWRGIDNDYKLLKKREARNQVLDYENENIQSEILESVLDYDHNSQTYHDNLDQFVKHLFNFIETHHGQKKATLFKMYFLTSSNSYQKLAEQSGYTVNYIRKLISGMKQDIKSNLIQYINWVVTPEVWKPVKNYESLYFVSNKGRLKNLRGEINPPKYKDVYCLWKNNERIYKSTEQLITGVFQPNEIIIYVWKNKI